MTTLSKFISKDFFKVDNPDHPFTFSGPDVLLSDREGLVALFIPTGDELISSNKLLLRLMNSKIAYPANTVMTLILEHSKEFKFNKRMEDDFFDLVIEPSDLKRLKAILKETKTTHKLKEVMHTQKQMFDEQASVHSNNLKYTEQADFKREKVSPFTNKEKISYYNYLEEKTEKVRSNIFYYEEAIVGFKNLSSKPDIIELTPYYEFVLRSELYMQNGVPFFKKNKDKKCLSLNELPKSKFDPLKPMRLASLFGWLIGNINNRQDLTNRLYR
jgi:hypothetical protein